MTPIYRLRHHGCRADEVRWRGHRLVVLENELLRIGVLPSKGADIIELRYKPLDLDLLWHAPQPILPAGEGSATSARAQGAFLDHFSGGWQEILPNAGPATLYKGADLGQHGEAALLPWDARLLDDLPDRVSVEFSVDMLRTPFRLVRVMSLESGSPRLTLTETVTNQGEETLHYAWGHHPALGAPFLEAGCQIQLPPCDVTQPQYAQKLARRFLVCESARYPYLTTVEGNQGRVDEVQSKQSRTEDVLLFSGYREGLCAVRNPRSGLSFTLMWDPAIFPYLWCWQVYGGSWGYPYYGRAYTLAIEPFNCPIMDLAEAVKNNVVPEMKPGASVKTELAVTIAQSTR